ncbi:aldo/keto reductase [Agromyces larvae]|uniref:Aldo/keto reductase n=1 Tax=Agromyces larvae TaxID=2929802 RepID=A0ABY4BXC0_9MICO|nr:aldo/keto reductase [Agromyces larvae]UOE43872.1 aldo/keto reductase [Agromyces larvae]
MDRPALAPLGLGLAALGRPAYITTHRSADLGADRSVAAMRERAHRMLDAAWERGIRFIDAARSYGLAEEFLGSWLAAHPDRRTALTIESKWGYEYVGEWRMDAPVHERKEHSLPMFERQWPATLAALGGAPDVYLIHSLTPDSPALGDAALLDRLRELAASGVRVGISTSGPRQGDALDAARELADSPFSAVQATWNLLEPSAGPALSRARDAGWLVVVKEAVANGRLAPAGGSGVIDPIDSGTDARVASPADARGASVPESVGEMSGGDARDASVPESVGEMSGSDARGASVPESVGEMSGSDARGASVPESAAAIQASAPSARAQLASLADADGQTLDAFAIGAARSEPWADVVLSGAVTPAQLDSNLASRAPGERAQRALAGPAAPAEQPDDYWAARSARDWT